MFVIYFLVYDKVGNYKISRKVFFYDNIFEVIFKFGKVIRVIIVFLEINYEWVIKDI